MEMDLGVLVRIGVASNEEFLSLCGVDGKASIEDCDDIICFFFNPMKAIF
jgi:hypothetical protein